MKKFLQFILISAIIIVVLGAAAYAALLVMLPADKIKDMLAAQLSDMTGREVSIKELKLDLFKGMEMKGFLMRESEAYQKADFIRDDSVALQYNLPALFTGNLIITKFEFISPYAQVIKEKNGKSNFLDIIEKISGKHEVKQVEKKKSAAGVKTAAAKTDTTFLKHIIISKVAVRNANLVFKDNSSKQPAVIKIDGFNFSMDDIALGVVKPINMNMSCDMYYNDIKVTMLMKAAVKADLGNNSADIVIEPFNIGGIKTTGNIKLTRNFTAAEMKFTSTFAPPGAGTADGEGKMTGRIAADMNKQSYTINIRADKVKVSDLIADAAEVMPKSDPKSRSLMDNLKNTVSGDIDMAASFSGATFDDMANTIKGSGDFAVKNGKLSAGATAKNIGDKFNIDLLKNDIPFDLLACDYDMAGGRINIKNFRMLNGPDGKSGDVIIRANGYTTVDEKLDIKAQLDFSPKVATQLGDTLASLFSIRDTSYACNADGWLPMDVRIYNTVKDQKYDYSQPRMTANVKKRLGKKVQEEGTKFIETKGRDLIKNLFGR